MGAGILEINYRDSHGCSNRRLLLSHILFALRMDITQRFKGLLLTEIASHLLKTHAILTHDVQYIPYRWPYAHLFRMGYLLLWHWLPSGLHLSIFSWFKKITTKAFQVTKERLIFFDIYMPILLVH